MKSSRLLPVGLTLSSVLALAACSALEESKLEYRSAQPAKTLELPPDLKKLNANSRYTVPSAPADTKTQVAGTLPPETLPDELNGIRYVRQGQQRWLEVDRTPESLWEPLRQFWTESGFTLELDQQQLGVMETNWAENRSRIPQDFIRNVLGRLFDGIYSSGERDKFRMRLERNANGKTEITISHRAMSENYTNAQKDSVAWQLKPSDPEMEIEFLRRIMLKLSAGGDKNKQMAQTQSQAAESAANKTPAASAVQLVKTEDGLPALRSSEDFDRVWRRLGQALDRQGFTVEERDRSQGTVLVRYGVSAPEAQQGFFSRLFSSSDTQKVQKYRIRVTDNAQGRWIAVQPDGDQAAAPADIGRILAQLEPELR